MNDKAKNNVKKGKHHHLKWLSPQIFACEEDERNHCSCRFILLLSCTPLYPNHGYSFTSFLLNSTTLEANRVLNRLVGVDVEGKKK